MEFLKDNNIIYFPVPENQVTSRTYTDDHPYVRWSLYPIAVWDYVDPDMSDAQGWVQELKSLINLDIVSIVQYIKEESLDFLIDDEGYERIEVSTIYCRYWAPDPEMTTEKIDAETAVHNSLDVL